MQLKTDNYTVAWLCALPESELLAALYSLDEEHDPPNLKLADSNSYHYGSINGHNIVIACMPPGDPGIVSANSLVQPLRANFRFLRIHLFVGLGGGVPFDPPCPLAKDDIHLGDVVIGWSSEVGGPAVVQYDLGRIRETNFQMTAHSDRPDRHLATALGSILMNQRRNRTRFQKHLDDIISQNSDFAHPGQSADRLYKQTCLHGDAEDCSGCSSSELVDRPTRQDTNIIFHQSTIASGNSLIKNAIERDRISGLCHGARCFEMEAAGVINEIRPLVIRGIADYADGHKNWKWHDYAAAAAASFAKEFLYTIAPNTMEDLQPAAPKFGKS
jgi:nucleoside phosphorylase